MNNDQTTQLLEQVSDAYAHKSPLCITSGGSKAFYGNQVNGNPLDINEHSGIIEYQPSELVLTARAGTPLTEIEATLAENGQMLAFEPPIHNNNSTFGGAIATGLSGPARAFTGSARDFVLGTRIINGKAELLRFGGQVMKNVAGYDASRLMVGAQGTLGVLLDISVKVLPIADCEATLSLELDQASASSKLNQWISNGLPITASCQFGHTLVLRLSNTSSSVAAAIKVIGGTQIDNSFWKHIRHQSHDFYSSNNLWRLSLPPATGILPVEGPWMVEWGGALRWYSSETSLHDIADEHGGHATRYALGSTNTANCFQPIPAGMMSLQSRIKHAFDPEGILNPGRVYQEL